MLLKMLQIIDNNLIMAHIHSFSPPPQSNKKKALVSELLFPRKYSNVLYIYTEYSHFTLTYTKPQIVFHLQ